jgi:hypothetical protein
MCTAFPCSDYYGSSAPPRRHRLATCLPARPTEADRDGTDGAVPNVHARIVRQARCPALPLQHRHGYAVDLHRGLEVGEPHRPSSSPHEIVRLRAANQPRSIRFELVNVLRSVRILVHSRYTVLSCLPDPQSSDGADPSRRCQGCSHPPRRSPRQAALSFNRCATTHRRPCPFTTARSTHASWRTGSHVHF